MLTKIAENTGIFLINSARVSGRMMILLKETGKYSPFLLKKPKHLMPPLYVCMVRPLLLVAAVSFLTGVILAMQTGRAMMDFGFEDQVGGLVAVSLAREMGPLWAAVIVTARRIGVGSVFSLMYSFFEAHRMVIAGGGAGYGAEKGAVREGPGVGIGDVKALDEARAIGRSVVRLATQLARGKS